MVLLLYTIASSRTTPRNHRGTDVRDVLRPKDGGNALVLFIAFGHGDTSRQEGLKSLYFHTPDGLLAIALGTIWAYYHIWIWIIPLALSEDKHASLRHADLWEDETYGSSRHTQRH